MTRSIPELTQKILNGYRIKRGNDLEIFKTGDLEELEKGAGAIQRRYRHNHVDLCSIINGRSGRCPEDYLKRSFTQRRKRIKRRD